MGKAQRERHRLKTVGRDWTAWNEIPVTDEIRNSSSHMANVRRIWANSRFEVHGFEVASASGGFWQVVIARHGRMEPVTCADLERIKCELFGPDSLAFEVYPRQGDLRMAARIMWVAPAGFELPVGLHLNTAWGGV